MEAVADIFAKEWSVGHRSIYFAFLAIFFYVVANASWLFALREGSGLVRGSIIFSVSSAILASFLGIIVYRESLTGLQIMGVALGLISILVLVWE